MKILYVASEALPFAASGGLGDVIGSLPPAVKEQLGDGSDVRVVIPMYPSIKERYLKDSVLVNEIYVSLSWRRQYLGIWSYLKDGVVYYFLDNEFYFKRHQLYGEYDDGERFAFFCKAVIELMQAVGFFPDILHANDWQSALSVIYLKRKYGLIPGYDRIKTLYTIHNIEYQGIYDMSILGDVFDLSDRDREVVEFNRDINLTKGAITVADRVSTVSEQYAKELTDPYYAHGLDRVILSAKDKMCGIVNGIDVSYYNPQTDPQIKYHYSVKSLVGKTKNKKLLQERCGLEQNTDIPIIAMVSRLVTHKGFDLVCRVIEDMLQNDNVQFVLLGTGDSTIENFFKALRGRYPGKICAMIEFNKELSKLVYAGSDMFLMPSKSEPCGLSQMIASRYGSVPIVRETGGLYDTIRAYNKYDKTGNGFSFANYNAHEMMGVIREALSLYFDDRTAFRQLVKQVMSVDFSWNVSAKKYIELYRSML